MEIINVNGKKMEFDGFVIVGINAEENSDLVRIKIEGSDNESTGLALLITGIAAITGIDEETVSDAIFSLMDNEQEEVQDDPKEVEEMLRKLFFGDKNS